MELSKDELSALTAAAKEVAGNSYSPYSRFSVGAAVLTDTGEIVAGCNVENASLGLTVCAERNAIFAAVARGARRVRALLIYTPTAKSTPPCGSCRQVLREFAEDCPVICTCDGEAPLRLRLSELLPHAFDPRSLCREESEHV